MASVKSTFYTLLTLLILLGLVAGGAYGWQLWQRRQVRQTLDQAKALIAEGNGLQADRLLNDLLMRAKPSTAWAPEAVARRLEALEQAQDRAAQETLARTVLQPDRPWVQPGQEAWARAQLVVGEAALQADQAAAARQAFEALLAQPGGAWGREEAQFGLAKVQLAIPGEFMDGKKALDTLMERLPEKDPLRRRVGNILGEVNLRILLDRQPVGDDQLYTIAKGDTIEGMSRRFKISPDLLMKVNGITDPKLLTIGRRLKIPAMDFSIVVDKTDNTLTLMNHEKYFKQYRVRTGESDYMTPSGDYTIGRKVESPPWTNPKTRETFAPGAPGNELGARWLGFRENPSIGIHEAVDATTVGTYGSNGCVGLAHDAIIELADLVRVGTPVRIVGQKALDTTFRATATPTPVGDPSKATPAPQ